MRRSSRHTWLFFSGGVIMAVAGMIWLTNASLRLERAQLEAQEQARFQSQARVALWRMDSSLAPFIAREAARPYNEYSPFFSPDIAFANDGRVLPAGEVLIPSPLQQRPVEWMKLHFQITPEGDWVSPQTPDKADDKGGQGLWVRVLPALDQAMNGQALAELRRTINLKALFALAPRPVPAGGWDVLANERKLREAPAQRTESAREYANRLEILNSNMQVASNIVFKRYQRNDNLDAKSEMIGLTRLEAADAWMTPFQPFWIARADEADLFYLRGVQIGERYLVQGFWVDWPKLRENLTRLVTDLFPDARLEPVFSVEENLGQRLTSIPAILRMSPSPTPPAPRLSPIRISLGCAWIALFAGVWAVGLGLHGLTELSERRLDFVSAVTHELRTPLTTFRMYSEMLASGMVADEARRAEYYATLSRESDRLAHLVRNVLDYARLERKAWRPRLETIAAEALLARLAERAVERCRSRGVELVVENAIPSDASLRADPAGLEQIIFNLVDNACKYGRSERDNRVHLRALLVDGAPAIEVEDHGPGLEPAAVKRLFTAFSRGERVREEQPGVGLGLALSARWARAFGGRLELARNSNAGACFRVRLNRAARRNHQVS